MLHIHQHTRLHASQRITVIGAISNLLLGAIKLLAGWFGHSHSLIADGFHSLADLATDALVYLATYFAAQEADAEHPYGHGRIETVATGFIAGILMVTGLAIIYDAMQELWVGNYQVPYDFVIGVALIAILVKELLYRYSYRIALELKSDLLIANAWHHRTDALSSVIVIVGVGAALLGYHMFDSIAAVVVGVMIMQMAWHLGYESISELIDTAVAPDVAHEITQTLLAIDGVAALHQLRTRMMRGEIFIDVHVIVSAKISVSEGHHICEQIYAALGKLSHPVTDIVVHIDPEDDEIAKPTKDLPARLEITEKLQQYWCDIPEMAQMRDLYLHYLDGRISVEVIVPSAIISNAAALAELQQRCAAACCHDPMIASVSVLLTA